MKKKAVRASGNIYGVVGSDESAVKSAAAELAATLTPADAGEFGLEIIDGCRSDCIIGHGICKVASRRW